MRRTGGTTEGRDDLLGELRLSDPQPPAAPRTGAAAGELAERLAPLLIAVAVVLLLTLGALARL